MKILFFLFISPFLIPAMGFAQLQTVKQPPVPDSVRKTQVFELGEIVITAPGSNRMNDRITQSEMESNNRTEVSRALNMLSGINLTASGPRNESMLTVRGFDLRQVPVYMDGIPVYVPYDGYVDLARFTTFDLSAIDVSKGFSSVLYGPNSLGGAINLVSRKPLGKFEFDGSLGMINTNGYRGNINVGSNLGKFYIQAGYSYLHRDAFRLSRDFESTRYEDGKDRDNAYRTDQKYHLKVGWTPNQQQEYVLGFIRQQGKKGTPVYTGNDTLNSLLKKPRFWQWPLWNKETYYFISKTGLGSKHYLKSRIYYDIFKNALFSYDDNTYSTMAKPSAFKTWYNDFTYGGTLEYGTTALQNHHVKFAVHFKKDVHRENDLGDPEVRFVDNTVTLGAEDTYSITDKLVVISGISFSTRKNLTAQELQGSPPTIANFPYAGASNAYNGQVGLFYTISSGHKIGTSFSHKTRFATIKDRYSYRMGTAIPNPNLKPETADNYELNYSGAFAGKISLEAALFFSKINNVIMNIHNVEPGKMQMQNAGKAEYMGLEATLDYRIAKSINLGVNYTYIARKNLTNPDIHFTDVPNTKVFGFVQVRPVNGMAITTNAEYNASRFSTSYGTRVGGFTLFNILASQRIIKNMSIEAGVNNLFDKNYSLVEGFPEEGRNFFLTLRFFNHR
ncbi:MAG TPA: TonB-dependent receptor [Agriterribacter sp.]|nr:TonB-dependent receptor [Agriterribacter sp.]